MHDSRDTKVVRKSDKPDVPEVRQSECECGRARGLAVSVEDGGPFVWAHVRDTDSTDAGKLIRFLVDTGSDSTFVPSGEIDHAQKLQRPDRTYGGVGGGEFQAFGFPGTIVLSAKDDARDSIPLALTVFEPDQASRHVLPHGILGMDALRKVIIVSDDRRLSFWHLKAARPRTPALDARRQ